MNFSEIISNKKVLKALEEQGIVSPTEIQQKAIPIGLDGKDIIAKSQTGTGKTLAFMLPVLETISSEKYVQALIICPTRELGLQVYNEILKYIKYMDDINAIAVYGGQRIDEQIRSLKKRPQIVVGTPGRLIDHLKRKTIKPFQVKTVVLDEADEMISIGFKEELETILEYLPEERQTVFFSATFPSKVVSLSKSYLKDPVTIKQDVVEQTINTIDQFYLNVRNDDKLEVLKRLIYKNQGLSIVFCNTKRKVDETVAQLQSVGIIAEAIHGDLTQQQRDNVMKKMRGGILEVMVATDVAARGIDVKGVEFVYNFDFPDDFEYYVHRIGRTGRAGVKGTSYTFITGRQVSRIKDLSRTIKADIKQIPIPKIEDVNSERISKYLSKLDFNSKIDASVLAPLIEQGHSFEEIAIALVNDKFSIKDFSNINENVKADSRDRNSRDRNSRDRNSRDRGGRNDRGDRGGRSRGLDASKARTPDGGVRLFISAGKKDNVRIKHIVGAFKNQSNIKESEINNVEIMNEFTFVTIPEKHLSNIANVRKVNEVRVNVEVANHKRKK